MWSVRTRTLMNTMDAQSWHDTMSPQRDSGAWQIYEKGATIQGVVLKTHG